MQKGVIYVARGGGYLELARASAASLRAHEPDLPIDIYTDQSIAVAEADRVLPIPDMGTRDKIACMTASRFERTLFLDCDTLVLNPLGDLFDLLVRFDLAVAHDVRRTSGMIRTGWKIETPYAFPQMNTGVMLYRRVPEVLAFLSDWAAAYRAASTGRDQVTFRDLLWSSDLRFYVLPPEFNLRRVTMLDAWEPLDARPTILHSHRLLQHLRTADDRMSDLNEILVIERAALAHEWQALGIVLPHEDEDDDPVARFRAAEKTQAGAPRLHSRDGLDSTRPQKPETSE